MDIGYSNEYNIVLFIYAKEIPKEDIISPLNYNIKNSEDLIKLIDTFDKVEVCRGTDSFFICEDIKSLEFVDMFGQLRHSKCLLVLKENSNR